jgi:uncharacterized protein
MIKPILAAALLAVTVSAQANPTPAKKALIDKVLKLQQPNVEALARTIVEAPAHQMGQQANIALQRRVAPEQREAVGKSMQTELSQYVAETVPLVRERAIALSPTTIGKVLDEKFSEAELKQLIAMLESPIYRKFSENGGAMQRSLQEQLIVDTRSTVEPRLKALDQGWVKRLQEAPPAAGDKPASSPAK